MFNPKTKKILLITIVTLAVAVGLLMVFFAPDPSRDKGTMGTLGSMESNNSLRIGR